MPASRVLRVLVVDDDREDFLILRDLLSDLPQMQFELDWAGSLAEGLQALADDRHDVYLVDYHLGPDSGLDLLEAALAPGRPRRPVIMLTGQGNPELDRRALEAGAADYLVKGRIDAETLARALRYAARHARQLAELEDSRQRYRLLFELNPFPTWVYDVETLRLVAVNEAMVDNYGYSRQELLRMSILDLREPDEAERLKTHLATFDDRQRGGVWRHRRKDGSLIWVEIATHPIEMDGRACRMVIGNDITEQREAEERLAYAANYDPVTGLPRFPVLENEAATFLEQEGAALSLLFLDVDRFHVVNESMGHVIGDEALRLLADRMLAELDEGARLARFAGDEFVAMAPVLTPDQAVALAERLRAAVAQPIEGDGYRLFLTASVGIARAPEHGESAMELLRRAEAAMGRAKRQGRDAACMFSVEQMQELEDRLVLGARLREAIPRGELELHYQPILDAGRRVVTGLEALVRWNSPELGRVPPGRFIPIAEALGLMPEVGLWVIDEACRQLRAWEDAGLDGFTVAVNVSALQLQRPDIVRQVRDSLARHGVPGRRLEIELTESSLMEHVDRVQGHLADIKALGVRLSLDDFGTGYSSLAYLKQFSLDRLKIDRSFVMGLPGNADDAAIARTIIAMGHQLRIAVAAEGVETAEQADFLAGIGCDELQGYHFGRPAPAAEIQARLPRA
ncbi:putative bifunctional diguanylate cyclase/phosphodiesterase [Arenimonas fontis]|uniref:cyclic-guanylate-specific phosphodiesterase n=1 Tax=Arenimonas fontis TaxID=2608255 RepID=A0A5B2ZCU6_9GAMM|nr:EAL domain-containing protein [Arenimonas fontis]KAA2285403.1 EAL domain-containing protein [Arenimonas fontis]